MTDSKQKFFPPKPDSEDGFKDPVSWLGGRELVTSLKGMLIYSLYGESIDPRPWMKSVVYPEIGEETAGGPEKAVNKAWAEKDAEYRKWKADRFEFWDTYFKKAPPDEKKEFWFDYIADSGDGQLGVYGVACMCLSDLWLAASEKTGSCVSFHPSREPEAENEEADPGTDKCIESKPGEEKTLLPRGSFLFIGGDTAYHVADYSSIHERFQLPFRWAFASVRKYMLNNFGPNQKVENYYLRDKKLRHWSTEVPRAAPPYKFDAEWDGNLCKMRGIKPLFWDTEPLRPLFGVPANHDYYDDLDGFNRQFRRPPFKDVNENQADSKYAGSVPLKLPTFRREQEASYTALHLPFGWWFLGIDSENEKLDFRQRAFFEQLMEKEKLEKVIVATPEPTTVFGRECDRNDKTAKYVTAITKPIGLKQPFLEKGELNAVGAATQPGNYCRLDLSGDVHHYARYWGPEEGGNTQSSDNYASLVAGGGGAFFDSTSTMVGEIIPQTIFPDRKCSRDETADRIFDLTNIKKGGYVQIAGAVVAVLIVFCLVVVKHIRGFFLLLADKTVAIDWYEILTGGAILVSVVLFGMSGCALHKLNTRLKDGRYEKKHLKNDGRIIQLRIPAGLFLLALILYGSALIFEYANDDIFFDHFPPFLLGVLLVIHLTGVGLALWAGSEYLNWLPLRFKFVRQFGETPDGWLSIFHPDLDKEVDKRFFRERGLKKKIWELYRTKTVENIPVFLANLCAVTILIFGIYLIGGRPLSSIVVDLTFTVVILGGLGGLTGFAISTGAAYHKAPSKKGGFALMGAWHAILQLATPFVLLYFGNWISVIVFFMLAIFMNGLSGTRTLVKFLFDAKFYSGSVGAWVMKKTPPIGLLLVWVLYGSAVLAIPFLFAFLYPDQRTIPELIKAFAPSGVSGETSFLANVLILAAAGYLGYRMSRIWVSWYFAVSHGYNGHNKEAGGAARIQGFKHILRIKVEEERLTVYVIGFDDPKPELEQLRPRLVDKFTLECKEFPASSPPAPPGPA
jgi:hypothetical protein